MSPSLRPSFRLKLQFVSAFALTLALYATPLNAMDVQNDNNPTEVLQLINLAQEHHQGLNGQLVDFEKAEKYYLKAAENGDPFAKEHLISFYNDMAQRYHYGQGGQSVDGAKAVAYYLKALANGGHYSIRLRLAQIYHQGLNGQFVDLEKAEEFYLYLS